MQKSKFWIAPLALWGLLLITGCCPDDTTGLKAVDCPHDKISISATGLNKKPSTAGQSYILTMDITVICTQNGNNPIPNAEVQVNWDKEAQKVTTDATGKAHLQAHSLGHEITAGVMVKGTDGKYQCIKVTVPLQP